MITKGNFIDLSKPIFVYYLDTKGYSKQSVHETIKTIYEYFPSNITLWVVPTENGSKIECIYNGLVNINKIKQIINLIDNTDVNNFSELKSEIRQLLLDQILNE